MYELPDCEKVTSSPRLCPCIGHSSVRIKARCSARGGHNHQRHPFLRENPGNHKHVVMGLRILSRPLEMSVTAKNQLVYL